MKEYNLNNMPLTKYLFYTGKGGVGKTSAACATAVRLADEGKKVLLISTDPASNLQDVFNTNLDGKGKEIEGVANLIVINIDPLKAAADYRESVLAPYRGRLPDAVLKNMEEQLSGSCTVEIAAFNEFTKFLADKEVESKYAHIIFDTAPTGHTLRMLQLPSAWTDFISESTHGASCLGQLSGLEEKKEVYRNAVEVLRDGLRTTMALVTRPEAAPLKEAGRASAELSELGIDNQVLIVNGLLTAADDAVSQALKAKQEKALSDIPARLQAVETFFIPLRAYNILGIENMRNFLTGDDIKTCGGEPIDKAPGGLKAVIDDLYSSDKKVIFTMGKGGVGKTTIAAAIAAGLSGRGRKVHLTTTDPARHLDNVLSQSGGITMSFIDEAAELSKYQKEVLDKARETMTEDDIAYIEEDLRSPCTQEIAVFRAFAKAVEKAENETVVIDTAPTGHTLLLLDSTESYHREVKRTQGGGIPECVKKLLPRLKNKDETEVIIVTLAEATPVYEAMRLEDDLIRAGIAVKWWVINSSFYMTGTTNKLLAAKANAETGWINKVNRHSKGNCAVIAWHPDEIKDEKLSELVKD